MPNTKRLRRRIRNAGRRMTQTRRDIEDIAAVIIAYAAVALIRLCCFLKYYSKNQSKKYIGFKNWPALIIS